LRKEVDKKVREREEVEEELEKAESRLNEISVDEMKVAAELEVLTVVIRNENPAIDVNEVLYSASSMAPDVQKLVSILQEELLELEEQKRHIIKSVSFARPFSIHSTINSLISEEEKIQRKELETKKTEIQELKMEIKRIKTHIKRNKTFQIFLIRFLFLFLGSVNRFFRKKKLFTEKLLS
jgi:DNA repair exonuclease SbcCD ATPase subunit